MTSDTELQIYEPATPSDILMRVEKKPQGPLLLISHDGNVTVTRGTHSEASKAFWDVINVDGMTYVERIRALEKQVSTLQSQVNVLMLDPFKSIVHGSAQEIRNHMHPVERETVSLGDIRAILDTINQMAMKTIQ